MNMRKPKPDISPEEERDLIESTERGEWVSVGNIEERRAYWQKLPSKHWKASASVSRS